MTQSSPDRDDFERWLDSRPEDDEPLTDEEREALAASAADIAAGRTVTFEEIKAINQATAGLPPDHASRRRPRPHWPSGLYVHAVWV